MVNRKTAETFEQLRQIHSVLAMHFQEGKKQSDIATMMNLSTAKVNRLIKQGRELGMLQITIQSPFQRLVDLEKKLISTCALDEALVTPTVSGSEETTLQQVGSAAAATLLESLRDGDTIAISGGKAISAVIENLKPDRTFQVEVVPLTGGLQGEHYTDVNHLATVLAGKLGGRALLVHAPLFAENAEQRDMLISMKSTSEVFNLAKNADVAVVGVGSVRTPQSSYYELNPMSETEREMLLKAGASAEFLAHLIKDDGQLCDLDLNRRLVAIPPADIAKIKRTIGVVSGVEKVKPIKSVLNGGYLTSLVVDEHTAKSVLEDV